MEERHGSRLVSQRHFEVEPPPTPPISPAPPASSPPPPNAPTESPAAAPPSPPGPPPRVDPSNRGLLERQLKWLRERAKFESRRPSEEGSR